MPRTLDELAQMIAKRDGISLNEALTAVRDCAAEMEDGCEKSDDAKDLTDKVQRNLAKEFKVLTLDFAQAICVCSGSPI